MTEAERNDQTIKSILPHSTELAKMDSSKPDEKEKCLVRSESSNFSSVASVSTGSECDIDRSSVDTPATEQLGKEKERKCNRRRPWTEAEDAILTQSMQGCSTASPFNLQRRVSWLEVAKLVHGRTSKQCRDRWLSICPAVAKREWTKEEDQMLIELYKTYKNRWVKIATCFEGRNDNMIKSRFRALSRMGLIRKEDCNGVGNPENIKRVRSTNNEVTDAALKRLKVERPFDSKDPTISMPNSKSWTDTEDKLLLSLEKQLPGQWSLIAQLLSGRSPVAAKLRFVELTGNAPNYTQKFEAPQEAMQRMLLQQMQQPQMQFPPLQLWAPRLEGQNHQVQPQQQLMPSIPQIQQNSRQIAFNSASNGGGAFLSNPVLSNFAQLPQHPSFTLNLMVPGTQFINSIGQLNGPKPSVSTLGLNKTNNFLNSSTQQHQGQQ